MPIRCSNGFLILLLSTFPFLSILGCDQKEPNGSKEPDTPIETPQKPVPVPEEEPLAGKPIDGARIGWDYSSQVTLDEDGGCYARIIRLQDGTHMAAYETAGGVYIKRSTDAGASWSDKAVVIDYYFEGGIRVNAANAEICQLSDGTLLCGANFRPSAEGIAPWSIAVSRSEDGGKSWTAADIIYEADIYSSNGCWEPYFLELPDGKVHVYFANEKHYSKSSEQEISCMISSDKGKTWDKKVRTVSFRKGFRDGMPVARVFNNQIVVTIEDNIYGNFVPFTVRCPLSDPWAEPVTADSECREQALVEDIQNNQTYGGAPYLLKLPSGDAVMSYQRAYGNDWQMSDMEVVIGDKEARNFARPSRPFKVTSGGSCLWNSVGLIDESHIVAVGSLNLGKSTIPVVKKGRVMANLQIQKEKVTSLPIFVGSESDSKVNAGVAHTSSDILIEIDVKDKTPYIGRGNSDGVHIYIDPVNKAWSELYSGVYRIWLPISGYAEISEWRDSKWSTIESIRAVKNDTADGYSISATVPKAILGEINSNQIRIGLTLYDYDHNGNFLDEDLVDMARNAPCTWLPLSF